MPEKKHNPVSITAEPSNDSDEIVRIAGPVPSSAWFIIVMELCERLAYYGATLLFMPYMIYELGLTKSSATAVNRAFQFFAYFTTIIGAILADVYWGKFKTIIVFALVYTVGLILLSVSGVTQVIGAGAALPLFCVSLFFFTAWGTGGIKANVSAFAAEQVPLGLVPTANKGVYFDNDMTVERVFRFFYWSINMGSLIGQLVCPIIANNTGSYPLAFAIPAIAFVIGIAIFVFGRSRYVTKPIEGNPLGKVLRCMKFAMSQRSRGGDKEHWLDFAKTEYETEWDHKFVDDLKRTLKACRVFMFYVVYWALYFNMSDSFITQGMNMKKPKWLGAEQLNLINPLALVVTLPIFDYIIFPGFRKIGFKFGPIARITTGFTICTLGFIYVTVLQHCLYQSPPYYNLTDIPKSVKFPENNLSIWYQSIAYVTVAISEIFASATGLEYAFKYASSELKSVVLSLFLLTNCGGSLIGLVLAIWSVDPNYVILFAAQTSAMGVLTVIFYFLFRHQDDEE